MGASAKGGTLSAPLLLPHYKRLEASGFHKANTDRILGEVFAADWPAIRQKLADPTWLVPNIIEAMAKKSQAFAALAWSATTIRAGYNFGALDNLLVSVRCRLLPPHAFQTTDALDERLECTDIGEDTPCEYFRLPYPFVFIEFGRRRRSAYRVHNPVSGEHIMEGCYLNETVNPDGQRVVQVIAVGSPVGKTGPLDDATLSFRFTIPDEEAPLGAVIEQEFSSQAGRAAEQGLAHCNPSDQQDIRNAVFHATKVLLYLNSVEARTHPLREWSDLQQVLERVGNAKRSKIERRMAKAYDRVVVGPESFPDDSIAQSDDRRGPSAHWRRGHYRRQPHGAGRADRKLIWIRPALIGGVVEQQKNYIVR